MEAQTVTTIGTEQVRPGGQLTVRPAHPVDLGRLEALLARCSPETLYRRFHGAVGRAVQNELRRIVAPTPAHRSWVAADGDQLRGTATLAWGSDGTVEAAFLVEDAWFRRGVGTALFGEVAAEARRSGVGEVLAMVQADNERARRFLRSLAPGARTSFLGMGEVGLVLPVWPERPARALRPLTAGTAPLAVGPRRPAPGAPARESA